MSETTSVDLVGVGGQGIILGAALLARAALHAGFDVKSSEVKGMAQRGGSVVSTVRFGDHVYSPLSPRADVVLATEVLEARRAFPSLVPRGTVVSATTCVPPGSVLRGEQEYPDDVEAEARRRGLRLFLVDAEKIAAEAGSARAANVVLLGAASVVLPFGEGAWGAALEEVLPARILAVNRCAFRLGREVIPVAATS